MSREAVDIALGALHHELERAVRALDSAEHTRQICAVRVDRLRSAIRAVRGVLERPAGSTPVLVPAFAGRPEPNGCRLDLGAPGVLGSPPTTEGRTVRSLIKEALAVHDQPEGLHAMAVAVLIAIDKAHVGVELAHLAKQGTVSRVAPGRYRVASAMTTGGS